MQPPTAGRIVWYYNEQLVPTAAIVNQDADAEGRCSLTVFHPTGTTIANAPECDMDEPKWGFWSWMPYQRAKADSAEGNESESAVEPDFSEAESSVEDSPVDDTPMQGEDPHDSTVETTPEEEEEAG